MLTFWFSCLYHWVNSTFEKMEVDILFRWTSKNFKLLLLVHWIRTWIDHILRIAKAHLSKLSWCWICHLRLGLEAQQAAHNLGSLFQEEHRHTNRRSSNHWWCTYLLLSFLQMDLSRSWVCLVVLYGIPSLESVIWFLFLFWIALCFSDCQWNRSCHLRMWIPSIFKSGLQQLKHAHLQWGWFL